jgi:hypothetical protein
MRLLFDVGGDLRRAAQDCEAEVFGARFGTPPEQIQQAYRRYRMASRFMVVIDRDGGVQAAARLILPGPAGLKTLHDVAGSPWRADVHAVLSGAGLDPRRTLDAATFSVREGLGKTGIDASLALLYGLFVGMHVNRVPSVVSMIDERVRGMLEELGLCFRPLPGTAGQPFSGVPAREPVYAHLGELLAEQRRRAPQAHRAVTRGIGLAGVHVPPPEALRIITPTREQPVLDAQGRPVNPAAVP